jgi:DHA3 family tetracycline resistance protein-like MFS transporter
MRRMFSTLKLRDFRMLWTGLTVSLIGDGLYFVALAWEVYRISNVPTAMSAVGLAWTLPLVLFVLLGGVVTDRFDRRKVMIASDAIRGTAVATMSILSLTGTIRLWHVFVLVAVYGSGEAFFGPALGAIVPQVVPEDRLVEANSLDSMMDPLCFRLLGPALGGLLVATVGSGAAFAVDAGTFVISALAVSLMRPLVQHARERITVRSSIEELKEGFRFVRAHAWLWGTLLSATAALLCFWGPLEVLLPFIVKNEMNGSAGDYGLVLATGGVGAVIASITVGSRGLPRRFITFMYLAWAIGIGSVAGYGLVDELWQLHVISFFEGACVAAGLIVWKTTLHRMVPQALMGRVTSLDWFMSIGLVPLSFGITGPIAEAIGARTTMVFAGIFAATVTTAFLFIKGVRDPERTPRALPVLCCESHTYGGDAAKNLSGEPVS